MNKRKRKKEDVKRYVWTIEVSGIGHSPEEAWDDCCDAVAENGLGEIPEAHTIEEV